MIEVVITFVKKYSGWINTLRNLLSESDIYWLHSSIINGFVILPICNKKYGIILGNSLLYHKSTTTKCNFPDTGYNVLGLKCRMTQ